jgi:hypothetical protein
MQTVESQNLPQPSDREVLRHQAAQRRALSALRQWAEQNEVDWHPQPDLEPVA